MTNDTNTAPAAPPSETTCAVCGDPIRRLRHGWIHVPGAPDVAYDHAAAEQAAEKLPLAESEAMASTFGASLLAAADAARERVSGYSVQQRKELEMHARGDDSKPEPAGALKAILAAAEGHGFNICFHVVERRSGPGMCGRSSGWHPTHPSECNHPFVSLATLLSSVAELASAPVRAELRRIEDHGMNLEAELAATERALDEARTSDPALLSAALYREEKAELFALVDSLWKAGVKIEWLTNSVGWQSVPPFEEGVDALVKDGTFRVPMEQFSKPAAPVKAAESYRLLETGEIIQEGDEFTTEVTVWHPAKMIGEALRKDSALVYRRPITGGAGLYEAATCSQESQPLSAELQDKVQRAFEARVSEADPRYLESAETSCPRGSKIVPPGSDIQAGDITFDEKPVPEDWIGYLVRANAVPVFRPEAHPARIVGVVDENARLEEDVEEALKIDLIPAGILTRLSVLEECGVLLSEIHPAEARLVIAALATVFSS